MWASGGPDAAPCAASPPCPPRCWSTSTTSAGLDPAALPDGVLAFLAEHHLATLTTLRADGSPHVVPVGFTFDPTDRLVRVIAGGGSAKVAHVRAGDGRARVALCQVDRRRWLSLEGDATVSADPARVAAAVDRYRRRYREPRVNPDRVVIEVTVTRVLGRVGSATSAG